MNTLYIFDMGGVLCENFDVIPSIAKHLGMTEKSFFIIAGENFRSLLEGKMSSHEFWKLFSLKSGRSIKEELFEKYFHPRINSDVKEIIKHLKAHSRVVCGTNVIDSHYTLLLKRGDYAIFDGVYASHLMGISKPDSDFYQYILQKEDVKPEKSVFVDDTEENVTAAKNLGIKSILFVNPIDLKYKLKN